MTQPADNASDRSKHEWSGGQIEGAGEAGPLNPALTTRARTPSDLVLCERFSGGTAWIERSRLFFRPAVYALIMDEHERVLLVGTRFTGKYFLPGGAIEVGEPMQQAILREVREETGIDVAVEGLFYVRELLFYHDVEDYAFHGLIFVYRCRPLTFDLVADDQVDDGIAEKPRWMGLSGLRAEDFQSFARDVFERLPR